ncbi:MAG TPA: hypothetical protein VFO76_13645 [Candidatus Kapabacteria bacterium]|nr:hypothetical protein [Candidatus Kapabacteria bacterium]
MPKKQNQKPKAELQSTPVSVQKQPAVSSNATLLLSLSQDLCSQIEEWSGKRKVLNSGKFWH